MGKCKKEEAFALMDSFYDLGGNFIDTYATSVLIYDTLFSCLTISRRANNYQEGDSERWIGEWMESRGNRDQMVYVSTLGLLET
jgi:aryl-alcohol dehydrogenase-like predicted oxidoreductase